MGYLETGSNSPGAARKVDVGGVLMSLHGLACDCGVALTPENYFVLDVTPAGAEHSVKRVVCLRCAGIP